MPGCTGSERLGYATIQLRLDTYSHVLPSMQREGAERIDALIFESESGKTFFTRRGGELTVG
ncbi:MAG: hypothetical protein WD273_09540 [Trueperaceae bacterium]